MSYPELGFVVSVLYFNNTVFVLKDQLGRSKQLNL